MFSTITVELCSQAPHTYIPLDCCVTTPSVCLKDLNAMDCAVAVVTETMAKRRHAMFLITLSIIIAFLPLILRVGYPIRVVDLSLFGVEFQRLLLGDLYKELLLLFVWQLVASQPRIGILEKLVIDASLFRKIC